MNDNEIVELFTVRDESALEQTEARFKSLIRSIAYRMLANREDCDEVENDTYLAVWNSIPPAKPTSLSNYVGRISR